MATLLAEKAFAAARTMSPTAAHTHRQHSTTLRHCITSVQPARFRELSHIFRQSFAEAAQKVLIQPVLVHTGILLYCVTAHAAA